MKYFLTPSTRLAIGLVLFAGSCCVSTAVAQPPLPPPPPPAPGVDSIAPVVEPVPIVHPSLFQDDLPPVRFGLSHQIFDNGIDDPFTDFRFFLPTGNDERVLFFDGRALFGNHMGVTGIGYNLGVGARAYSERMNAVWGINLFADRRQTALDRYHQVGIGTELLSETWEVRGNSYLPTGSKRNVSSSEIVLAGAGLPYFRDQFISIDTLGTLQTFEQALRGFDFEVGRRFNRLGGPSGNWLIRGYLGGYYYENPDLGDFAGMSLRLNANYRDAVEANVKIQNDGYFGTQTGFGVAVYFDGLFDRNQTFHSRTLDVRNHLARPVERKQLVTVARGSAIIGPPVTLDLTDPMTGNPITVTHIDSNGAGADLGTFEDPFLSLTSAAGSNTDIVYVYSGSIFNAEGYALAPNQRFLGEGGGFVYDVDTAELGTITLPDGNGGAVTPLLMNSPGDAIVLASNTEVTNFDIMLPVGSGIAGNGASNAIVNGVLVTDSIGSAASLIDSSVTILDSVFSTSAAGAHGIEASGTSTIDVQNTPISTGGVGSFGVTTADGATVNLSAGSTIDTTGNTSHGVFTSDSSQVNLSEASNITTTGDDASGVRSTGSSSVMLDAIDLATSGLTSHGVMAADGSSVTITNGSTVTVNAADAIGLYAISSSDLILSNSSVSALFHGVVLEGTSSLAATNGASIETSGTAAFGVLLNDNSTALLNSSSIVTMGDDSIGINALDMSTVDLMNGASIETSGADAFGLWARGTSSITVDGSSVTTSGDFAIALYVTDSALLSVSGGSMLSTSGSSAYGAFADLTSTLEILESTITTTNTGSIGLLAIDNTHSSLIDSNVTSDLDSEIVVGTVGGTVESTIFGNTLESGAGTVEFINFGGSVTVLGPSFNSLADFAAANGIAPGQVAEFGVITYAPSP